MCQFTGCYPGSCVEVEVVYSQEILTDECTVCGYKSYTEFDDSLVGFFQDPLPPNTRLKFVRASLPILWCDDELDGELEAYLNGEYMLELESPSIRSCDCGYCQQVVERNEAHFGQYYWPTYYYGDLNEFRLETEVPIVTAPIRLFLYYEGNSDFSPPG